MRNSIPLFPLFTSRSGQRLLPFASTEPRQGRYRLTRAFLHPGDLWCAHRASGYAPTRQTRREERLRGGEQTEESPHSQQPSRKSGRPRGRAGCRSSRRAGGRCCGRSCAGRRDRGAALERALNERQETRKTVDIPNQGSHSAAYAFGQAAVGARTIDGAVAVAKEVVAAAGGEAGLYVCRTESQHEKDLGDVLTLNKSISAWERPCDTHVADEGRPVQEQ